MKKNPLAFFILPVFMGLFLGGSLAYLNRQAIERGVLEYLLHLSTAEYFSGPVRLTHVQIDRHFKIHIRHLEARLKTKKGPIPLEMKAFDSQDPLTNLFGSKPVRFHFEGLRPSLSMHNGLQGEAVFRGGKDWAFELTSRIQELGLEEVVWINPGNLSGASGEMTGEIKASAHANQPPSFGLELKVSEPGGNIQARFFDFLLPYLPSVEAREKVRQIAGSASVVGYQNALLRMNLAASDKMKVFLHILIPDYNLDLNVNMEIRTDQKNGFFQIAQLMGLLEVKTS